MPHPRDAFVFVARVGRHQPFCRASWTTLYPRKIPAIEALIKFAIVGGTTFIIDSAIFYTLKLTVLESKPVTAKVIAGIHWEALRLWVKRTPVHDHPTRSRAARLAAETNANPTEPTR